MLISYSAPTIEAAGGLQRALQIGVLGMDAERLALLKQYVPASRGGMLTGPEVDEDWLNVVKEAIRDRNIDLEGMKASFRGL